MHARFERGDPARAFLGEDAGQVDLLQARRGGAGGLQGAGQRHFVNQLVELPDAAPQFDRAKAISQRRPVRGELAEELVW